MGGKKPSFPFPFCKLKNWRESKPFSVVGYKPYNIMGKVFMMNQFTAKFCVFLLTIYRLCLIVIFKLATCKSPVISITCTNDVWTCVTSFVHVSCSFTKLFSLKNKGLEMRAETARKSFNVPHNSTLTLIPDIHHSLVYLPIIKQHGKCIIIFAS